MSLSRQVLVCLWSLIVAAGAVHAQDGPASPDILIKAPKWEVGVGLASLYHPHYLGADQQAFYLLPVPYFVYRGEYIRADRQGLLGYIYNSDRLNLRMSIRGSLPVNSEDNRARSGMDDLDLLVEAGPTLQYLLYSGVNQELRLDLPVRAAFSLGDTFFRHQGWTSNPQLHYEYLSGPWIFTSNLGVVYSDRHYHGYIYDVGFEDVTAARPYYHSTSGYTAARFTLSARRRIGDFFIGAVASYYDLDGAANIDSPLLRQRDYFAVSAAFSWVFGESKQAATEHRNLE